MGQMEQDQRLPFAPEHKQGCVQTTGKGALLHLDPLLQLVLTKRCILEERNARPYVSAHRLPSEDAMSRLEGKIAVITGANSGIGLANAKRVVAERGPGYITGGRTEEFGKGVQTDRA